jgi:hypothetical protein
VVVILVEPKGGYCSATKIAPRRFLTAGHCVVDRGNGELLSAFRRDAALKISSAPTPLSADDFIRVSVEQTQLPSAFEQGLRQFIAYKQARIADFNKPSIGTTLRRRMENLQANPYFTTKFPDAAVIRLQADTTEIPQAQLDLTPLRKGDAVTLVGYGCDNLTNPRGAAGQTPYGVRRFGSSQVIRVDPVNFYSYGRAMRLGAPSICPGDSGGPVLRKGKIVGVHGAVHGIAPSHGANTNMSVNLSNLASWSALNANASRLDRSHAQR